MNCTISDGMKILLAEDDATSADYIRKGLTEQGYVVDWVTDGRDALTHCLYNPVDLAIVDRMMPGWTGCPWSRLCAPRKAICR